MQEQSKKMIVEVFFQEFLQEFFQEFLQELKELRS